MLILKLSQLKEGVQEIFDHLREKSFVIFELDKEINANPKMIELNEELSMLRAGAPRRYGYLAIIITGVGDKSFRDTLHRDCLCVRPKALSKKEVQELGLPSHKVIISKTSFPVSYKLMTQVKKRENGECKCKWFFLSQEGGFLRLGSIVSYEIMSLYTPYCVPFVFFYNHPHYPCMDR